MSYIEHFMGDFTSKGEVNYIITILKKGVDPLPVRRILLAGTPAVQAWEEDDPLAPIRGSKLTVSVINHNNSLPLTTFYSPNDDEYKIILTDATNDVVLFEGYLVQDDCIEDMVDYNHTVTLTASDNLGLLKEIRLDEALTYPVIYASKLNEVLVVGPPDVVGIVPENFEVGEMIAFYNLLGTAFYGTYTILAKSGSDYTLDNPVPFASGNYIVVRSTVYPVDENITLFALIQACLQRTGIRLPLRVYCNMKETTQSFNFSFLVQTYLKRETFLNGEDYDTCWDVLEKILKPFGLSLYQANGNWVIRKWDELHYISGAKFYSYTPDYFFVNIITETLPLMVAGIDMQTKGINGLNRRIERPFEYVKETFNYKQPQNLLKNSDLQQLGALVTTYASGTDTVREYLMPYWFDSPLAPATSTYRIVVVTDSAGEEKGRYVKILNDAILSTPIDANTGDKIKLSFGVRTVASQGLPATYVAIIRLTSNTSQVYARNNGTWTTIQGYTTQINNPTTEWNNMTFEPGRIPFDGLLEIFLVLFGAGETHYQDIRLEYTPMINESSKIIGQIHKDRQDLIIKNNIDETIYIDDAPRNSIAGVLLLGYTETSLITAKTTKWSRYNGDPLLQKLGQIATTSRLARQGRPLTIMEGSFFGLVQNGAHFSANTVMLYTYFPDLLFIFGRMEIDYMANEVSATAYEAKDHNAPVDFLSFVQEYTFTYIYAQN